MTALKRSFLEIMVIFSVQVRFFCYHGETNWDASKKRKTNQYLLHLLYG